MTDRIITSTYSLDSAGRKQGKPIFTEKGTVYETDFIIYNLKTKRAQIKASLLCIRNDRDNMTSPQLTRVATSCTS